MKKLLFLLLLLPALLFGQNKRVTLPKAIGGYHGYLEYKPKGNGPFPLLLFLSGQGEIGTDLSAIERNGPPNLIKNGKWLDTTMLVISPQTKTNYPSAKVVLQLIDYVKTVYPIDTTRIYLTGLSAGGGTAEQFISVYPEKITAAFIVCGSGGSWSKPNPDPKINALGAAGVAAAKLPVMFVHNLDDPTVKASQSLQWFNGISDAGGYAWYVTNPTGQHNAWGWAYDQTSDRFEGKNATNWLLQHQKQDTNVVAVITLSNGQKVVLFKDNTYKIL